MSEDLHLQININTIINLEEDSINEENIELKKGEGINYMNNNVLDNSVDLILTDPPYITSRKTGMDEHYNHVVSVNNTGIATKTEEEWSEYKKQHNIKSDSKKKNYLKYGTIYGKKYAVKTNYGSWDKDFTMETLDEFIKYYYLKLRPGGTLIIWFDLWKITPLKEIMENYNFKQIRMIEWIKTNPQPINSSTNYLTNCREIALLGVKESKPTFNSKYDNAIYQYPLQGGRDRFHPTTKSLNLFIDLINKHSNEGDLVLDTFSGSGTTAIACKKTNRRFKGCELDDVYYEKSIKRLENS
jgi:site-specific DNA-methyltransferase (adenine-specific)